MVMYPQGALPELRAATASDPIVLTVESRSRATLRGLGPIRTLAPDQVGRHVATLGDGAAPTAEVLSETTETNGYASRVRVGPEGSRILLKVSYHPYWSATIDGATTRIHMVAPNLMAVDVPEGDHDLRFEYRNPTYQKALLILALLVFLAVLVLPSTIWERLLRRLMRR
jgi:hypothetical protein